MKISELKDKISRNEKIIILDVREPDEFGPGDAIPGAVNMPMGKVFVEAAKGVLPKDEVIVTVCRSALRSAIVARELKQKGYQIDYLEGGIGAWKETNG